MADTLKMHKQLTDHGLKGLSTVLVETGSFIAGSYAIPSFSDLTGGNPENIPDDRDIDIWLPYSKTQTSKLGTLTQFLVGAGYEWPTTLYVRGSMESALPTSYRRLKTSISRMFLFHGVERIHVQILCLHETVGGKPAEIVHNFDMTMLQRWYDGKEVQSTTVGQTAFSDRLLTVNTDSQDVCDQTLGEWVRTLKRLIKYQARQFQVTWTDKMSQLALKTASQLVLNSNGLHLWLLHNWNDCVRKLDANLPYLVITNKPPASRIEDLRVITTTDGRFILDSVPPMLHWNELTQQEQQDALPIDGALSQSPHATARGGNSRSRLLHVHGFDRSETVLPQRHRVSTLVPFPTYERRTSIYEVVTGTTTVYAVALAEHMDAREFLKQNETDNVILVDPQGNKTGLSRSLLIKSKTYMACTNVGDLRDMNANPTFRHRGIIAQIPLGEYTIYVPQKQLLTAMRSSDVYFGLQEKDGHFEATISQDTLLGHANMVSADHCQEGSSKAVWRIFGIDTPER